MDGKSSVLGYFFGPLIKNREDVVIDDFVSNPNNKLYMARFGDPVIIKGEWEVVGSIDPWDRDQWPMPVFTYHDEIKNQLFIRHLNDQFEYIGNDIEIPLDQWPKDALKDGTAGYIASEIHTAQKLGLSADAYDEQIEESIKKLRGEA